MPSAFDQGVFAIVRRIPSGRVMTYGDIASLLPQPSGLSAAAFRRIRARWVGYAMARCPDDVPWHRVVGATGRISPRLAGGVELQRALLRREGIRVDAAGRVDLDRFAWSPSQAWLRRHGFVAPPPLRRRPHGG
ncbi:MAG TPA: MGMT family protein [Anaerolineales bacterium]|nr:MGMT family protein [Anaerolineales bacterium]